MNLQHFKDLEITAERHDNKNKALNNAVKRIADIRKDEDSVSRLILRWREEVKRYFGHSREQEEALVLFCQEFEKLLPDMCRVVEMKLSASARAESTASRLLKGQIDSFFTDTPVDDN